MKKTILLLFLAFVYVNAFCYSVGTPATPNTSNEYVISKAPAQSVTESNVDSATMLKTMEKITPEQKQQIKDDFWGKGNNAYSYLVAFVFALMGLFLRWYFRTKKGVANPNNGSPDKFSWSYWFKDNALPKLNTLLASSIIIFVSLRFSSEIATYLNIKITSELVKTGISMSYAFLVGLFFDNISNGLKSAAPKTNN